MKLNLNIGHGLGQQQQLGLAPQLLQWLRMLQVPAQQLEQMVRTELEANPALEEVDDVDSDQDDFQEDAHEERVEDFEDDPGGLEERMEILAELDREWEGDEMRVQAGEPTISQERADYQMNSLSEAGSLRNQLLKQVAMAGVSDGLKDAAELIIGSLDERGYLDIPLQCLSEESGLALSVLEEALKVVQGCDPAGVGARDLKECLLLQLEEGNPEHQQARMIIEQSLEAVAQGRFEAIADKLDWEVEDVEEAVHVIRTLDPNPGKTATTERPVATVTPDIFIRKKSDSNGFEIELADQRTPRLRISHTCRTLIEGGSLSRADLAYVRKRVRAAMFLIEGLRKREVTLYRIAEEIIRVQHRFLCGEEREVRPLTMAKVAAIIGVHDTTVSRALAEKYVETPVGLFPMKHFFQVGYQCEDGSAMTPEMVRRRIHRIILDEDPSSPIKDDTIASMLQKDGVPVARRTVAKYRGELGIASSKERALHARTEVDHQIDLSDEETLLEPVALTA